MKELSAPIFNIVHGSMVDGWGLRTTVFLKGCPLRCLWCCNPEGQMKHIELKYTVEDCNGCSDCVDKCPKGAIRMTGGEVSKAEVDRRLCDNCLECVDECFTGALSAFGKPYTVNELFREIERDQSYFGAEGGVTIGGGEATLHPDFTLAFIRKCRDSYIHTALDTCGYITTKTGLEALAEADLALYDLKGLDEQTHIKATGLSNKIILENLKYRDSIIGKEIIVRLPIIPGFTDSERNLRETAELLTTLKTLKRVDIIPFHKYSEIKYRQLGWPLPEVFMDEIPKEREAVLKDFFLGYGLNAQIGG